MTEDTITAVNASIALVTCAQHPDLTADDRLLLPALERLGCRARPALWDDPAQRWRGYDAVVLRSTWDYHHRLAEFLGWLDRLEAERAPVCNGIPTLRWNVAKTYLRDLETAGIPVTPTVWVPMGSTTTLREVMDAVQSDALVVKPTVSASAFETWRVYRTWSRDDAARFARLSAERDLMIQPFLPVIETEGELSFIFLRGEFSHAVRKRPKPGDFRVQEEHGGTAEREPATPDLVRQAERAVDAAPEPPLYARADGVVAEGKLVITELELVEPMLYLGWDPNAADRLAAGIERALR
jgi:glutathione synthase/RimK-type ligase-like ATP-grasp enzyme